MAGPGTITDFEYHALNAISVSGKGTKYDCGGTDS